MLNLPAGYLYYWSVNILCISDEVDPLVYSPNVKKHFGDVDLVLSAGDLGTRYYEFIISSLNKPLLFVNGNHKGWHPEDAQKEQPLKPIVPDYCGEFIDGRVVYLRNLNLIVAGLGGSMEYNGGPDQYSETFQRLRMLRLFPALLWHRIFHGRWCDILLTHAAPRGVGDGQDRCHTGFTCFNTFIRRYRPRLMLHGHVHVFDLNERPVSRVGDTTVVNVFKSYVIDTERPISGRS